MDVLYYQAMATIPPKSENVTILKCFNETIDKTYPRLILNVLIDNENYIVINKDIFSSKVTRYCADRRNFFQTNYKKLLNEFNENLQNTIIDKYEKLGFQDNYDKEITLISLRLFYFFLLCYKCHSTLFIISLCFALYKRKLVYI
jgi:hypothetical protein